ncbi:MAG: DUF4062 domain-containing protein [Paracoccaceae bacterium]
MYRKIIKVFLGSPGDLEEERKAAKAIVEEENANHANALGYHIDLVGWEDTVSQRRRAQDAINVDLDQCEYFVGLMWKKWGTPPGTGEHPYTSGFEEEYRRSVERHEKSGKPEISLLFKNIPKDDLSDVGQQLAKVLAFQKEINEEKKQYYQKFADLRDFEQRFRAIIAKFLKDQQLEDSKSEALEPQQPKQKDDKGKDQQSEENQSQMFDSGAMSFIHDFVAKESDGDNAYSAAEVARFRLLACSVSKSGNDSIELGTHDANLIYRDLRDVEFSDREFSGLLSTALESLDSSTVPLWHWIFQSSYNIRSELPVRTLWGGEKHRRNAFKLLAMASVAPNDFESSLDNSKFPEFWFSENVSDELVIAALEYLGAVGADGIQIDWDQFIGSSEANVSRAAVRSLTRIKSRNSTTEALLFVADHENVDLGSELTSELLSNIETIETEVLRACLKNRTRAFRSTIAKELFERTALTKTDAHLICESAEADVRLIGAKALAHQNPGLTLSDIRKLLVKPRKSNSISILPSPQDRDYAGEEAFEDYKVGVLCRIPYNDLLDVQKDESFFSSEATIALYRGHFRKVSAELEKNLLDGFEEFCATRRDAIEGSGGTPSDAVYNYVRERLIQSGLEAFCAHAGKSELATVRKIVDDFDARFATEVVEFFAKHGEWEDADRIAKLSGKMKYGFGLSLLSISDHSTDYELAARTILKLGSKRVADVWKLELPSPVRVQLVVQMPKKLFTAFDDQGIIGMLLWDSDVVREVVALKANLCFPKTRLRKILDAYYNVDSSYYYNAIFWLDLGVSADRTTSKQISLHAISAK